MGLAYFVGLDLGQTSDPTAMGVLERATASDQSGRLLASYAVRHLKRWKLGTRYPIIANEVVDLLRRPPLPNSTLAVDQTGVGRPVVDTLRDLRPPVRILPITITTGTAVTRAEDGGLHVPKKELVSTLQVLLQAGRLKVANTLPDAAVLVRELQMFRVKVTAAGNETFESWRERDHDDLVLAVALAAWAGENTVEPYTGPLALNDWAGPWHADDPPAAGADNTMAAAHTSPLPPLTPPDPHGDFWRGLLEDVAREDDAREAGAGWWNQ